jgi:hypothetical protein
MVQTIHAAARDAGRSPDDVVLVPRLMNSRDGGGPKAWLSYARFWKDLGAQYVIFSTMRGGFTTPDQHLHLARQFKDLIQSSL